MRPYIKEECFSRSIFGTRGLGALTVRMAQMLIDGKQPADGMDIAGHGRITLSKQDSKTVIMADPIRFTKENIDQ